MSSTIDEAALGRVFSPAQVEALTSALRNASTLEAERKELRELRALLTRVVERLDRLAPEGEVPEEHLAIMCAVFAAHIGKHVRIRAARLVSKQSSWSQAGRAVLHQRNLQRS